VQAAGFGVRGLRALELVGVAASGKTTLFRALLRSERFAPGVPVRGHAHLRHGLVPAARLLPAWLGAGGRWLNEKELRSLSYVAGWAEGVERAQPGDPVALFDHGPLFRIARLRAFGPPLVASAPFRRWAAAAVRRWAGLLGGVIWLDAPDDLLLARIEGRAERHRMQGESAEHTRRFIARYRAAYESLLRELALAGGPEALRIDTSAEPATAIADRLLAQLGQGPALERHAGRRQATP